MSRRRLLGTLVLALLAALLVAPSSTAADELRGTVSGTVVHPAGEHTTVQVTIRRASGQVVRTVRPQSDGRWSAALPAGTYRVRFDPAAADRLTLAHHPADDVVVAPGASVTGVDAALAQGGRLRVSVPAGAPGPVQVHLSRVDDGATAAGTRVSGPVSPETTATVDRLPAGTYRAHVEPMPFEYSPRPVDHLTALGRDWQDASGSRDIVVTSGATTAIDVTGPGLADPPAAPWASIDEWDRDWTFRLRTGDLPAGTQVVSRQWYARDALSGARLPVPEATGTSFAAPPALRGQTLMVRLLIRDRQGRQAALWTTPTTVLTVATDSAGTVTMGSALARGLVRATVRGPWPDVSHLVYRWSVDGRLVESNGHGALRVPADAVGRTLTVEVSADVNSTVRHLARASAVVQPMPRRLARTPRIQDARAGRTPSVSGLERLWTPAPDPRTGPVDYRFRREWLLDGRPVAAPKRIPLSWAGRRLQARITLTQPGYETVTTTTPKVVVAGAQFDRASRPGLWPEQHVGDVAEVDLGHWSPRPRFTVRWFVGGKLVRGARSLRLPVRRSYLGRTLTVEVTAQRPGYETVRQRASADVLRSR